VPCEIGFEPIHFLAVMKVLAPALRIYCVLLVLALVWIFFLGRLSWNLFVDVRVENLPRVILLTLGTSSSMVALSLYCGRNFLWAQQLEEEFAKILVPMKLWEITAIGLLSGIAEELFFRGALQTTIGLIPASLAFGLAHLVPRHPFWNWSLYAAFAGFLLGCLFELTHYLLPVMVAHALTNFVLIVDLNRRHTLEATN
jgi:membrane protease YdiL (CAAX protease family)